MLVLLIIALNEGYFDPYYFIILGEYYSSYNVS